jgi:hypothetical protein
MRSRSPFARKSPLYRGRCFWGWKPNPDGRPKEESGSCVKDPTEKGKRPADKPRNK